MTVRQFGAIAAAVWALMWAGCGGDSADPAGDDGASAQAAVERGWSAYATRDFSVALVEFERAVNLDASQADAHNGLGWTRLHLLEGAPTDDVLDLAADSFGAALRVDGDFADAWVGMGQALYMTRGGVKGLLDAANALASARGASPASLYRHDYTSEAQLRALEGWCYFYAGDPTTASSLARAATELDPNVGAATLLAQVAQ
ncbi:hypothetical protein HN371_17160 [Candidatus Poribacteria bacterium]|nr:hypothetical protein [Candidatus Poribacteria bacterium]MBT5534491.1 hypothetical protein [Candidatus Poribacteria bacterium]MBT5711644.1 hypothetical protein [Candidatus Poribacteria bacterium]MBT7806916.1 hypothetical protein [Candidatus Poribacteria bacterium]